MASNRHFFVAFLCLVWYNTIKEVRSLIELLLMAQLAICNPQIDLWKVSPHARDFSHELGGTI